MNNITTKWINYFKGIAMLGVIMVHFGVRGIDNKNFSMLIYHTAKGVYIFILISAYLAYYSLSKRNVNHWKDYIQWMGRKISKIIPLYYLALLIHLFTEGLGSRWWLGSVPQVSIGNILAHVFFVHGFNPYYCNSIIGVEWYIGVLFMLYLIAPILYKFVNNFSRALVLYLISSVVCSYYLKIANMHIIKDDYIWAYFIENFTIISLFPLISLGIVFYYGIQSKLWEKWIGNKSVSYFLIFFSGFILYRLMRGSNFYGFASTGIWALVIVMLAMSQMCVANKLICNPFFEILGKYSYGIYLFHFIILNYMPQIPIQNIYISWIVNYIWIVGISLAAAVLLNKFVEQPVLKRLDKIRDAGMREKQC